MTTSKVYRWGPPLIATPLTMSSCESEFHKLYDIPNSVCHGVMEIILKAVITLICSVEAEPRRMLERLDSLMSGRRIHFKHKKSRSLSVRKCKIDVAMTLTEANKQIPTVNQEAVKSLCRWCDSFTKDTRSGQERAELATG